MREMDILEMLVLSALLGKIDTIADNDERKDELKEAAAKANEEHNTDIKCEIAKLKKERTEEKKYLAKLIAETNETEHEIELLDTMIQRLENLDEKINN